MTKNRSEIIYLSSIGLILFLINYQILDSWFIIDDTACIFCSSLDTIKLLFDRGTYIFFSQLFFTPLLPILFKIDVALFKMNPLGYHIHNLVIAFLSSVVFYKILRMYCSPFFSWLGTIFLSISLPISFDIGWITRKHYLWGFLFSLITVYLFKKWEEDKRSAIIFLSILSTLLAFLCKEAYIVLPAVIFVISSGSIIDRVKKTVPYVLVFLIYLIWRVYMLGGVGGYPGSTEKSLSFLLHKLLFVPLDLSHSLIYPYFSVVLICLLFLLALYKFRMAIVLMLIVFIVNTPYIFYPSGGFSLAGKALIFMAIISFTTVYTMFIYWDRKKRLFVVLLAMIYITALWGSFLKAKSGHEYIVRLSNLYERASKEILTQRDKKILIISKYSYYFSNLKDIYKNILKEDVPYMKAVSTAYIIPFLNSEDFDIIILCDDLSLEKPDFAVGSVSILKGVKAREFIDNRREKFFSKKPLTAPEVNFISSDESVKIDITDTRRGKYLRCLYMDTYIGCYPIPRKYIFKFNSVKKFEKIDIIYITDNGKMSRPATFRKFIW